MSAFDWSTLTVGDTLCIVLKWKLRDDLGNVARSLDVTYLETTRTGGRSIATGTHGEQGVAVTRDSQYVGRCWWTHTDPNTNAIALKEITSFTECFNIGWRFGLKSVYVLDERLRPVPLGCDGEPFRPGSIMCARPHASRR
ncbi:hypothetical protein K439DRAFT_521545 [Ramaria rubella]|nr:hypothetical protein K439DRAFT_521545 [Ramaria rubella]